jgi:hypothetical protein
VKYVCVAKRKICVAIITFSLPLEMTCEIAACDRTSNIIPSCLPDQKMYFNAMTSDSDEIVNSRSSRAKPLACNGRHRFRLAAHLYRKGNIKLVTCVDGGDVFPLAHAGKVARVIPSTIEDHAQRVAIRIHDISHQSQLVRNNNCFTSLSAKAR